MQERILSLSASVHTEFGLCAVPDPPSMNSPFEAYQSSPDNTPQKPLFQPPGLGGSTEPVQESPPAPDPVLLRPPKHGSSDYSLDELARVVRASSSGIWSMAPGPPVSI